MSSDAIVPLKQDPILTPAALPTADEVQNNLKDGKKGGNTPSPQISASAMDIANVDELNLAAPKLELERRLSVDDSKRVITGLKTSYPDAGDKMNFAPLREPDSFQTTLQLKKGKMKLNVETNDLHRAHGANQFGLSRPNNKGIPHTSLLIVEPRDDVQSRGKTKKFLSHKAKLGICDNAKSTKDFKGLIPKGTIMLGEAQKRTVLDLAHKNKDLSVTVEHKFTPKTKAKATEENLAGVTTVKLKSGNFEATILIESNKTFKRTKDEDKEVPLRVTIQSASITPKMKDDKVAGATYWVAQGLHELGLDNLASILDQDALTKPGSERAQNMGEVQIPGSPFSLIRDAGSIVEPQGWASNVQHAWDAMVDTDAGKKLLEKFKDFPDTQLHDVELHDGRVVKLPKIEMLFHAETGTAVTKVNDDEHAIEAQRVVGDILRSESYPTLRINDDGQLEAVATRKAESTSLFHELIHIVNTKGDYDQELHAKALLSQEKGILSNQEEVRTIVGVTDDDLTENTLLKELGMPLRYAHQSVEALQKFINEQRTLGKNDDQILAAILQRDEADDSISEHMELIRNNIIVPMGDDD